MQNARNRDGERQRERQCKSEKEERLRRVDGWTNGRNKICVIKYTPIAQNTDT